MAHKVCFVVQRNARELSTKWRKSYGVLIGWVQTRMSFAILRATNLEKWDRQGKWGSACALIAMC